MFEGIAVLVYSLALSLGTMVLCYTKPLSITDKALLIICSAIIGWFWTLAIVRANHKNQRRKSK